MSDLNKNKLNSQKKNIKAAESPIKKAKPGIVNHPPTIFTGI